MTGGFLISFSAQIAMMLWTLVVMERKGLVNILKHLELTIDLFLQPGLSGFPRQECASQQQRLLFSLRFGHRL